MTGPQTSGQTISFSMETPGFSYSEVGPGGCEGSEPFDIVDGKIVNWRILCGRTLVAKDRHVSPRGWSEAWLKISHPTARRGFDLDVVPSPGDSDDSSTYVQLYAFDQNGLVTRDYRKTMAFPFYN